MSCFSCKNVPPSPDAKNSRNTASVVVAVRPAGEKKLPPVLRQLTNVKAEEHGIMDPDDKPTPQPAENAEMDTEGPVSAFVSWIPKLRELERSNGSKYFLAREVGHVGLYNQVLLQSPTLPLRWTHAA